MLYSGADLIRTSGHQAERVERLNKVTEVVRPVENPAKSESSLNRDTQNALLRFARFVHKEGQKKDPPKPIKRVPMGLPEGYKVQLVGQAPESRSGGMIDIYI